MLGLASARSASHAASVNHRYASGSGTIEDAYDIAGIAIESSETTIAVRRASSIRAIRKVGTAARHITTAFRYLIAV